ncbi:flagellar basal body P-ring formation chaperone FlgA [Desulfopila aestuarii]|uniref:Flagella basal body P-ring formation protein FlgA n=1 Tax=Desulfopila aestuarii DSM 18488 TaxID=1121416 RepID=A0A1M7YDP6_9BACT|nr:flagellar basal body P-ring formation chaperone FlgA [Desulfopila aestuarii]SHO50752.1 flagella basal body P-ring formation protein FlgA [Desulfopila aestuarii DSM 18488]
MFRISLIILLLAVCADAYGLTVSLNGSAEVAEATVTLGDIATFDEDTDLSRALASQPVGQAPSPGQEITLQASSIIKNLVNGLDQYAPVQWQGATDIKVTRSATVVSSADVLKIIDTFIHENTREFAQAKIRFIPSAQPLPFSLPSGKLTWQVVPSDPQIIGSSRFSVIFSVDGRVRKNMSVRGQLEVLAQIVVLKGDVRKGTILGPQHLAMTVQDISELQDPILNPREVLGKRLLVSLQSGKPLAKHQVEFPPMVKKGELVRIILQRGDLYLTATGIARNNGIANETIRVQNIASKKMIYCRVAAPGVVEVAL